LLKPKVIEEEKKEEEIQDKEGNLYIKTE